MQKELSELINISKILGSDPAFVQGSGGNASVKTDNGKYMYVKASGVPLKGITVRNGWRKLSLDTVLAIAKDKSLKNLSPEVKDFQFAYRLLLSCSDKQEPKAMPSVDACLHAFLDKYVIHLHPDAVCSYTSAKNGRIELDKIFKNEKFPVLWVPYNNPGLTLAQKAAKLIKDYKAKFRCLPRILFFEKHGLFISAKTYNGVLGITRNVIKRCNGKLTKPKTIKLKTIPASTIQQARLAIRKAFFEATGQYVPVGYFYDRDIAEFLNRRDAGKLLSFAALTPDELMVANGPAMWLENCNIEKITAKINARQKPVTTFLIKKLGLFIASANADEIKDLTKSSLFIRKNACCLGSISSLNKKQQDFLRNWKVKDAYKATDVSAPELKDQIAIVTGAGSGLGKSIAIGLARAGGFVALADIDTKAATQTADFIKSDLPGSKTLIVKCDVTSEQSVREAFDNLLNKWGGLDILVNAAGVAPAGPVTDIPVEKWRFALEVNLTGYFLMTQAAARIMIKQDIGGSIINLSSKSGLDASKNNTPYNATKAGEIHMARGWAMELGQYNIRVNSVCPGNVFEGSKIWNPQYIKICAKKYGIKPEEVIPFYVNKTFLKKEIKGQDVADSVVFLCSAKARTITGQIIVPDAGQVLVR